MNINTHNHAPNLWLYFAAIILSAISFNVLLLANPGFFNHDELQRYDFIVNYGIEHYLKAHAVINAGTEFAQPMRPFPILLQGIVAPFTFDYPIIPKLLNVLTHGANACLLFIILLQFSVSRNLSFFIATLFITSPMVVVATGWSAALMDQWYVFWALIAMIATRQYVHKLGHIIWLAIIIIAYGLSLLSKETAIVLPAILGVFLLHDFTALKQKRLWIAAFTFMLPLLAYILFRWSAIEASFSSPESSYSVDINSIFENAWAYFSFPFIAPLPGMDSWSVFAKHWIWAGTILHAVMILLLAYFYGVRKTVWYLFFYMLVLLPVLVLPFKGTQYLYGVAMPFSIAFGFVLYRLLTINYLTKIGAFIAILLILTHTVYVQKSIFDMGVCTSRAVETMQAAYMGAGKPNKVYFRQAEGQYALPRIITGRQNIGDSFPVDMQLILNDEIPQDYPTLTMDIDCRIFYSVQ